VNARRAPSSSALRRRECLGGLGSGAVALWTAGGARPAAAAAPDLRGFADAPVFLLTTPDGTTPLFTERGPRLPNGSAGALSIAKVFAFRSDATSELKRLKLKADEAVVSSIPLDEALLLKDQPTESLGGRFVLQPNFESITDARALARDETLSAIDDMPLFYDARLSTQGNVVLFLKKGDLDAFWTKATAGGGIGRSDRPKYQISSVRALKDSVGAASGASVPGFRVVGTEQFGTKL